MVDNHQTRGLPGAVNQIHGPGNLWLCPALDIQLAINLDHLRDAGRPNEVYSGLRTHKGLIRFLEAQHGVEMLLCFHARSLAWDISVVRFSRRSPVHQRSIGAMPHRWNQPVHGESPTSLSVSRGKSTIPTLNTSGISHGVVVTEFSRSRSSHLSSR